ncbi:hypothetical protein [Oscillatoria acuminata]|uniref:Uncharacterized protein n=1 Tax=Oscillatoria acuminata PCC 6304 TaxID=56110 RepID=K9TFR2_9CYAN|nr:hypothetical protein [Oscillatoria acuminata]AFY81243.1 hypothetical protein Oscil6304_1540 [Oscillatoria acuminata PCC 6304]
MKNPQSFKKKALAFLSVGVLATGFVLSSPKPAYSQSAELTAIITEANAMVDAVKTISTAAFISTLGVLGGVLAIKYIKYNVFGS